jgi:phosphate/sulfate permease
VAPKALLAAIAGAVVGAALWALIAVATNYEVGYVAWAVGGLVGGATAMAGGRGTTSGMVCAGLAVAAILAGKVATVEIAGFSKLRENLAPHVTEALYEEWKGDALASGKVSDEAQLRSFMVDHGFTLSETPDEVTAEELADFRRVSDPGLSRVFRGGRAMV